VVLSGPSTGQGEGGMYSERVRGRVLGEAVMHDRTAIYNGCSVLCDERSVV
jgi:hypothetical protein